jgi:hypothetical protein
MGEMLHQRLRLNPLNLREFQALLNQTLQRGEIPGDHIADGELELHFLLGGFLHGWCGV